MIAGRILIGMIVSLFWDGNLTEWRLTAERGQRKCATLPLGGIWEISTPEKEGWPGLDKSDGQPQKFVGGSWELF